tara:strand:+ start:237 stop:410 length:174 start_codon:yes stop_codon:yes gene_type:complete
MIYVANNLDNALELIADEVSEQDLEMYKDRIRVGDYESLIDALDGFGYKMKDGKVVL